jgi:hypothetical protein
MKGKRILTYPQWQVLFPSPGTCGKSESFDITLLFKLLREICGLSRPRNGWDNLPDDKDLSLSADLARIKYYRNKLCHAKEDMEVSDDDFKDHWQRIKDALLRTVKVYLGSSKIPEWETTIDDLRKGPITKDGKSNIEELKSWYRQDTEMKEMLEQLPKEIVKKMRMEAQAMENQDKERQLQQGQYYISYVVLLLKNSFQ